MSVALEPVQDLMPRPPAEISGENGAWRGGVPGHG
jgi:hypothetical protein